MLTKPPSSATLICRMVCGILGASLRSRHFPSVIEPTMLKWMCP
jgi:hypothetical protein